MRLKRNIFWRVMILLAFSIVTSSILISLFTIKEHREHEKDIYTTQAVFLAERAERMLLWDDRITLRKMLLAAMRHNSVLEYAFVERQGKPYVHSFQAGVPKGLINMHGDRLKSPIVKEIENSKGEVLYDIAVPIGDDFAILHISLSRDIMDQNIWQGIVAIGGVAAAMMLLGIFFSVIIAKFTTKEVDRLTRSLQQSRDNLELRVEERTSELAAANEELRKEIVERKRAEKESRQAREDWESIFQAIGHPTMILDPQYSIESVNHATVKATGKSARDLVGMKCHEIMHGTDKPPAGCPMEKMLTTGHFETAEMVVETLDRILFVTCTPVLGDEGNLQKVIHIATDISEKKQAEKALQVAYEQSIIYAKQLKEQVEERTLAEESLRESEHKYRTITGAAQDAILMMDNEGNISYWNPAAERIFGYRSEEVIGRELHVVLGPQRYLEDYKKGFKQFKETGQGFTIGKTLELAAIRKDGTEFPIELSVSAIQIKGKWHATGILRDITERKRAETEKKKLEEQLRQSQKMEAIGQLAGGIAHDFNNILTAIMGYSNILQMKMGDDDPLRANVDQILRSSHKAAHLTQSLLTFSRQQIIHLRTVRLNEIIERIEKLLLRLIGEDIELKTALADKDLTIMADNGQIEQILMNLATNARDAMPEGGVLGISTELVSLDDMFIKTHGYNIKPGMHSLITVTDTGEGMDENTRKRIFEPFFTTKELGRGTGLGLSIIYGIVSQHNGLIHVYSEPERGTTFKIYLPITKSGIETIEEETLPPPKGGTETVLVAEDDEEVRGLIITVLEEFGYKVIVAKDGEEAIVKFEENIDNIDFAILDVVMPKKHGKMVYEEIRKIKPEIKAIFVSGYSADIIDTKGALEKGAIFVQKPVSPNELLRKVREVLDK